MERTALVHFALSRKPTGLRRTTAECSAYLYCTAGGRNVYFAVERIPQMSGMKSAYELAMERLGGESKELPEEQKAAIAEIDVIMKSRIAEAQIMFDQQLAAEPDPAKAAFIQQTRQKQIAKIKEDAEAEKQQIRQV